MTAAMHNPYNVRPLKVQSIAAYIVTTGIQMKQLSTADYQQIYPAPTTNGC